MPSDRKDTRQRNKALAGFVKSLRGEIRLRRMKCAAARGGFISFHRSRRLRFHPRKALGFHICRKANISLKLPTEQKKQVDFFVSLFFVKCALTRHKAVLVL